MKARSVRTVRMIALTAAASSALAAASANAQTVPATPAPAQTASATPAEPEATTNQDIIVTARLRNEGLLDVPVAVSVLSADAINKYNAADLTKIGELTPTVIVSNYRTIGGGSIAICWPRSPRRRRNSRSREAPRVPRAARRRGDVVHLQLLISCDGARR